MKRSHRMDRERTADVGNAGGMSPDELSCYYSIHNLDFVSVHQSGVALRQSAESRVDIGLLFFAIFFHLSNWTRLTVSDYREVV